MFEWIKGMFGRVFAGGGEKQEKELKELEEIKRKAIAALEKEPELKKRFEKFWETILEADWEKYEIPKKDIIEMLKRHVDTHDAQAIATGIRHMKFFGDPRATFGSFLMAAALKSDKNACMIMELIRNLENEKFHEELSKSMFVRARLYKVPGAGIKEILERIERRFNYNPEVASIIESIHGGTTWTEKARAKIDARKDILQAEGEELKAILEEKALAQHGEMNQETKELIEEMVEEQGKGRLKKIVSRWERIGER